MTEKKFSDYVNEFSTLWSEWTIQNNIAINKTYSFSERRLAAETAEKILNKRYYLIQKIDSFFSKGGDES